MHAVTPLEGTAGRRGQGAPFCSLVLLAVALLSGCATTTEVKVDSLAKPDAVAKAISYEIHNTNPLVADDSLRYKEASEYIKTALSGKGMYEAPANTKADMIVEVDYGIGPPQSRIETRQEAVYRKVPGDIRVSTVALGVDPATGKAVYGNIITQGPDSVEFDSYKEYQIPVTVYEKYIRLTARSTEATTEGRPQPEIWTVDVTSEGESRDLRKNLPVLVAASIDYIGKDSQGEKVIKIKDNGDDVKFIKKGL